MTLSKNLADENMPRGMFSRRARGAAAVETGIVIGLVLLLIFGIVEFGMLWRTQHTIDKAAGSGIRVASQQTQVDGYEQNVLNDILANTQGLSEGTLTHITLFRADPVTGLPASGEDPETCFTECYRFDLVGSTWQQAVGAQWDYTTHQTCDFVGLYLRADHEWVTGFFGDDRDVVNYQIKRMEPAPNERVCPDAPLPPAEPTPTPLPTSTPTPAPPTATPTNTPTPGPPTATPAPTATSAPTATPVPTATPDPNIPPTPIPTATPIPPATPTPNIPPTPTPKPTNTPIPPPPGVDT